jgi:hypothetical protein
VRNIRIEPEGPIKEAPCNTCGGTNHLFHGYVYDDGFAHGIYYLEWCNGDHPERAAFLTIGLGSFGEGSDPEARASFGIEWRADGMALTREPIRDLPDLLGPFVDRETALAKPNISHVWHVADHIVLDDVRTRDVERWLRGLDPQ